MPENQESHQGLPAAKQLCFVIMPFGGDDLERRKHFLGVYTTIIAPAATRLGLMVKRADLAKEPGNITVDIIRDLAAAAVVVADLTGANANVFFELGIRHVLRKSGTVHIADNSVQLPFDVASYRVINYSTDLSEIEASISEISAAIKRRLDQPDRSDNPVHDTLRGLPINYLAITTEALQADLETMQATINKLQGERDALQQRLRSLDIMHTSDSENLSIEDIEKLFDQVDQMASQSGQHVLLRLRKAAEEGGRETFIHELREMMKSPYLSQNDFVVIAEMCDELGLDEHERTVYMIATSRFPSDLDFRKSWIRACLRSSNPVVKAQGRQLLEQQFGISHASDGNIVVNLHASSIRQVHQLIGVLCDAYQDMGRDDWSVKVCDALSKIVAPTAVLIRNKARAHGHLGEKEAAEESFKKALDLDPNDDTTVSFYASFLEQQARYLESFYLHERAIAIDPEDPNRWFSFAIHMMNYGILPAEGMNGSIGPIPRSDRRRLSIPLVLGGIRTGKNGPSQKAVQSAITLLVRMEASREAEILSTGRIPDGDYNYLLVERIQKLLREAPPSPSISNQKPPDTSVQLPSDGNDEVEEDGPSANGTQAPASLSEKCPKCGRYPLPPSATFCGNCGTRLASAKRARTMPLSVPTLEDTIAPQ